jgi:hypothetical protein
MEWIVEIIKTALIVAGIMLALVLILLAAR